MIFVYRAPEGAVAPPDKTLAQLTRRASQRIHAYLRKNFADEVGAVRFAMRWDDGTERMFYIFLSSSALVYDEATKRNAAARGGRVSEIESIQLPAPLEGVTAGRALGPILGALIVDALYPSAETQAEKMRQVRLLKYATARRPSIPEPERRALLGAIAKRPVYEEEQVRALARLLYGKELPSREGMARLGRLQNKTPARSVAY